MIVTHLHNILKKAECASIDGIERMKLADCVSNLNKPSSYVPVVDASSSFASYFQANSVSSSQPRKTQPQPALSKNVQPGVESKKDSKKTRENENNVSFSQRVEGGAKKKTRLPAGVSRESVAEAKKNSLSRTHSPQTGAQKNTDNASAVPIAKVKRISVAEKNQEITNLVLFDQENDREGALLSLCDNADKNQSLGDLFSDQSAKALERAIDLDAQDQKLSYLMSTAESLFQAPDRWEGPASVPLSNYSVEKREMETPEAYQDAADTVDPSQALQTPVDLCRHKIDTDAHKINQMQANRKQTKAHPQTDDREHILALQDQAAALSKDISSSNKVLPLLLDNINSVKNNNQKQNFEIKTDDLNESTDVLTEISQYMQEPQSLDIQEQQSPDRPESQSPAAVTDGISGTRQREAVSVARSVLLKGTGPSIPLNGVDTNGASRQMDTPLVDDENKLRNRENGDESNEQIVPMPLAYQQPFVGLDGSSTSNPENQSKSVLAEDGVAFSCDGGLDDNIFAKEQKNSELKAEGTTDRPENPIWLPERFEEENAKTSCRQQSVIENGLKTGELQALFSVVDGKQARQMRQLIDFQPFITGNADISMVVGDELLDNLPSNTENFATNWTSKPFLVRTLETGQGDAEGSIDTDSSSQDGAFSSFMGTSQSDGVVGDAGNSPLQNMLLTLRTRLNREYSLKNSAFAFRVNHQSLGAVEIQIEIKNGAARAVFKGETKSMERMLNKHKKEIINIFNDSDLECENDSIMINTVRK